MSLPGLIAQPILTAISNPMDIFFNVFNTNPYFIGLMMVVLNIGGKFLSLEITKGQEHFFQLPMFRKFIFFVILFISTRNIWVALTLSIIIVFVINYLLNECSSLYLFKTDTTQKHCSDKENPDNKNIQPPGLTPEESDILQKLSEKRRKLDLVVVPPTIDKSLPTIISNPDITSKYIKNVYRTNIDLFKNNLN